MLAGNPRPEELDETWSEPEQATWVRVGLTLVKADGTPVTAEFLRPREWVDRLGLRAGAPLPIAVAELEVEGYALVTSITPCPPIAEGAGRVVTGRFVTQAAGNLVRVLLADGTEIRATDVHPVWSVDREEWVPAGELLFGELLDTLAGPVAVERVERLESPLDVYTNEVHGEHVFRVTADGVLVHNACASVMHHSIPLAIQRRLAGAGNPAAFSTSIVGRPGLPNRMPVAYEWHNRIHGGHGYIANGGIRGGHYNNAFHDLILRHGGYATISEADLLRIRDILVTWFLL